MTVSVPSGRVLKKLSPAQPGAIKLARRFGAALVCVRHRQGADPRMRVTTVELVVEEVLVQRRAAPPAREAKAADGMVAVRIAFGDREARMRALNEGAWWDHEQRVWRMPRAVAHALDMGAQIVESG